MNFHFSLQLKVQEFYPLRSYTERNSRIGSGLRESSRGSIDRAPGALIQNLFLNYASAYLSFMSTCLFSESVGNLGGNFNGAVNLFDCGIAA
jgi:hypothetical protein